MTSAADQKPIAAASPVPSPGLNGLDPGAGVGTSTISTSSVVPSPAHGLAVTGNPTNGNSSSSSTPTITDHQSPPAQIVSDIPAAAPPTSVAPSASALPSPHNFAIRPPHSHSQNNVPGAPHSPALPSTPGTPTQILPKNVNSQQGWVDATPQNRMPSSTPARGHAVDSAPGTGKPSPPSRMSVGFPSPRSEAMQTNQKFLDDCDRLKFGMQQALPEAVRRSVRDNWETCLLGSPFHQAFVLNASIHHATPAAIQRGMRDFGKTLINNAKTAIVEQMTTHDVDQLADLILSKASIAFYDKCLEKRLKTIDAKRLINALARAERLGYEISDVQEEEEEDNTPALQAQGLPPQTSSLLLPTSGQVLHCGICFRRFPAPSAYNYHVKHKVCTRSPSSPGGFKYNCQHCGQGFTTPVALQYHNTNKVCGDFGEPTKANLVRKPVTPAPASASGAQSHTPLHPAALPSHVATHGSSPVTPSASKTASPAPMPAPTGTPNLTGDPYAHLSPEQLAALQSELREAEIVFTERMRQASFIVDPGEKKAKFEGLSNSFGTKQSLIRKKYGVRLRQRRTKTEIQQERDRMQYKTASEIQAEMGVTTKGAGRPPASSSYSTPRPETKTTVADGTGWAPVNQPTTLTSNIAVPASKLAASANVSMHGPKKRRFSGGGETPDSKRVAYGEMGGLGGANLAEAATMDPTLPKGGAGTKEEPMALDDSPSESDGSGSDSDSADEDIPAELPASVKQTLVRSSPPGGANRSGVEVSGV